MSCHSGDNCYHAGGILQYGAEWVERRGSYCKATCRCSKYSPYSQCDTQCDYPDNHGHSSDESSDSMDSSDERSDESMDSSDESSDRSDERDPGQL